MEYALLQPDILEVIFSFLDGNSLEKVVRVCPIWSRVVNHISSTTNIWKQCCEEEIPEDVLTEITINLHPSWQTSSSVIVDWRMVYKCWCHWHNVENVASIRRTLFTAENVKEYITCIKVSGSCILTGHSYGGIHAWNCYKRFLGVITAHLDYVTDLGLVSLKGTTTKSPDCWDVRHELVVSTSDDHRVQVSPLCQGAKPIAVLRYHMAPTTMVRVCRDLFAVLSEDEHVSVWKLCPTSEANDQLYPTLVYRSRVYPDTLRTISLWNCKLTGITREAHLFSLRKSIVNHSGDVALVQFSNEPYQFTSNENGRILKEFHWRHLIGMWLTDRHSLRVCLYQGGSHEYNPMEALTSYPVSLLLYGQIFLMGMDSGTLFMYYIESPEDLLSLDLKKWCWTQSLSADPILGLDISDNLLEPIIVATTFRQIFIVTLILNIQK